MKIDKLMARIDKPIVLPESRRNIDPTSRTKAPAEFVRNVQGSSAGAGSGEFHVYRSLRRKEYARLQAMDSKDRKEREKEEYETKIAAAKQAEEEKTAKKREKRKRRNKGGDKKGKKKKGDGEADAPDADADGDEEEAENDEVEEGQNKEK
ncbi:DUF1168-domain-containing protein [Rhizoclosmatium globosum]|uniref:DUF1168-domain-containing protein n=1 Tax=Rhizoclosmatium globosum TaxID=329046 RepID=A0A1Y2CNK1_9FUNG|nr:DUF1168-domain-containing protein [Rhizoclosmatium globosum]|eukprot:ORY48608.1 DUF1168-domain-containing protein [Rhizoclosmatium globosum]